MDYIANLKAAIAAVEAQPELSLDYWHRASNCGTIYCIGGLCAVTPHFTAQGMLAGESGAPFHLGAGGAEGDDEIFDHFFGEYEEGDVTSAYRHIFCIYGYSPWDQELNPDGALSHKDLALARLRKALAIQIRER